MPRPKGSRNTKNNYFAIYKGDEFIAHGDVWELSWRFNMRPNSLRLLSIPSYREKASDKCLIAIRVDELEPDDLIVENRRF